MDKALRLREILLTRGVNLYTVSQRSAEIFGRSSQFFIPHNLYYDLAHARSTLTIRQLLALSHITNYRLFDWLAVLGFEVDAISKLRLVFSQQHTAVLDSTVYDEYAWVSWFAERRGQSIPPIAPLSQFLMVRAHRAKDLLALSKARFVYAVVGDQDLYACPPFAPGTLVRADPRRSLESAFRHDVHGNQPFFLLEHDSGWTCSRLCALDADRAVLSCPQYPCVERELRLGKDAKILGAVDAEIRPIAFHRSKLPAELAARNKLRFGNAQAKADTLKDLLRQSRVKVGLSFREASLLSHQIAQSFSDETYFAAASTLSDYEELSAPPRQIQKIITLCIIYCIGFEQFLRAAALPLDRAGREPIPDRLMARQPPELGSQLQIAESPDETHGPNRFLDSLWRQWEEIPLFLRQSLDQITGLRNSSVSDIFWVGGDKAPRHPLLINASFVSANRRIRRPPPSITNAVCEQPLYIVLGRDGNYLCGRCTLEEGDLVLHGYPGTAAGTQRLRDGVDAEIVGQVTAILRRLR